LGGPLWRPRPFDYELVYISEWSKLGFSNVEYGYDKPTMPARW
jgi:hypothetical protein